MLTYPIERDKAHFTDGFGSIQRRLYARYSPFADDLAELFAAYGRAKARDGERRRLTGAGGLRRRCRQSLKWFPFTSRTSPPRELLRLCDREGIVLARRFVPAKSRNAVT